MWSQKALKKMLLTSENSAASIHMLKMGLGTLGTQVDTVGQWIQFFS